MTILSALHASRIRNRSMGVLHLIAADEGVEYSDILALITPSQPPSQAPAARMSEEATSGMQAEAAPQTSADLSETAIPVSPEPQPTSTPAVQEHIDDTVSNGLVERPTSPPGAEGSAVPAPSFISSVT